MAHRYFVWKNRNPQEWEELTRAEFQTLMKSSAAKGRYFAKVLGQMEGEDSFTIESTKKGLTESRKEVNRDAYLAHRDSSFSVVNFTTLFKEDKNKRSKKVTDTLDKLVDPSADVEAGLKEKLYLKELIRFRETLCEMDKIIFDHYIVSVFTGEKKTVTQQQLGEQLGISQGRLSQRKKQICELCVKECDLL